MRQLKIQQQITVRESKSVTSYFNDINKEPMVEPDEESDLAIKIQQGDKAALERLIKANLRFVVSVAKQYQNKGLNLEDLISEGNIGLVKAAERFDHTKGFKFISYAVWWIRQSIMHALGEYSRQIRLPQNQIGLLRKINSEVIEFMQRYDREPTPHELSEKIGEPVDKVEFLLNSNFNASSLDAPLSDGSGDDFSMHNILSSTVETDKEVMRQSLSTDISKILDELSERQAYILSRTFGIGCAHAETLEEISEELGLSRERVRQIKDTTIRKIKAKGWDKLLIEYL